MPRNARPRLHHYVEVALTGDRWVASCATAAGAWGVSGSGSSPEAAVGEVVARVAETVGVPAAQLVVDVEQDPSPEVIAAAPRTGESYVVRACLAGGPDASVRQTVSLGTNVIHAPPPGLEAIPRWVNDRLADEFWLTRQEQQGLRVEVCQHPEVDGFQEWDVLREHAWEANEPVWAAMRLRHKERLDALPRLDALAEWMVQSAAEVMTEQGHHRYDGPELTSVADLAAACRIAADLLDGAHPEVLARLKGLGWRALAADPAEWRDRRAVRREGWERSVNRMTEFLRTLPLAELEARADWRGARIDIDRERAERGVAYRDAWEVDVPSPPP